jgi:hypothetical protein
LKVGDTVIHRQYGVGVVSRLLPLNSTLVKAVFESEDEEKIVQVKYLKEAHASS